MIARKPGAVAAWLLACVAIPVASMAQEPAPVAMIDRTAEYQAAAQTLEARIQDAYAYPERLPGGRFALTQRLAAERDAVRDRRGLIAFAERALMLLADHHAITGASFADSYALVPSYADLWIEPRGRAYVVTAVRPGSPADRAGVRDGAELVAIGGVPTAHAVAAFWADLGTAGGSERDGYAARVLAAGRRDHARDLTWRNPGGAMVRHTLASLYADAPDAVAPVTLSRRAGTAVVTVNNALGDSATIAAFDRAMAGLDPGEPLEIDLTETASGGNSLVARGIMGWFAGAPTPYQRHALPQDLRETGIAREWLELVLPRPGIRRQTGPVTVRVGRWTGSMGEGLAIGLVELGARLCGTRMAGLLGAVEDIPVGASGDGLTIKLPVERLMRVDGTPREAVVPRPCGAAGS